ncbi:hypothetical protein Taro_047743 [Colocasia esculenta]|uniref:Remorin C-terminal domain-containing protein n=1 Tax=Colocasia esculenta TaxID=4460 RepID=A0A843X7E4_COLES|nr:hypothetical protein [Colocasia esculenta]
MPRLGLQDEQQRRQMEGEQPGDPAARRRKQLQQRGGGRRRGRGGGGGGGGTRREQSSASNAILLLPSRGSNHARGGGTGSNRSNPGPIFASSGSSLVSSSATSAASGADLCSFGSDHDVPRPRLPPHLAGSDRRSGPDPCRENRRPSLDTTTPHASTEVEQDVVGVEEEEEGEEEEEALDPAKHSFSIALKECQNRRFRSDALGSSRAEGKHWRRRPASLDLNGIQANDASFSSPGFFIAGPGMKKSTAVSVRSRSGTFPSPSTPNYRHGGGAAAAQKGWSSERVPLPANSSRRYGSTSALLPFNNGRTLPSKWEDAEKWIFSPVSGEVGMGRSTGVPPHHRRPKSKSGPLGTPAGMGSSYSSASPPIPVFNRGRIRNFAESSPFLTGVLITDRGCCGSASSGRGGSGSEGVGVGGREVGGRRSYSAHGDEGIVRSASVHGCSDVLLQSSSSLPSSRDEKLEGIKDAASTSPSVTLRKDVATQMSPQDSGQSSPKEEPHFSPSTASSPTIEELQSHFSKLEVRDVQVDDRVTVTRWSKKHIARGTDKSSSNIIEWKKKTVESRASSWEVAETSKCISKSKREEAKITAWENLQKAKAEAAIRKLEMKLEKKRSSSMDKILSTLKSAQRKAQEMRNVVTTSQANQVARTPKISLSSRKAGHMSSLSGCFTCHAF